MPELADGRLLVELQAQRSDFPSEDFFGLGPESRRSDDVTYGLENTVVGARAGVRPTPWLMFAGRVDHLAPRVSTGAAGRSIEQVFAPGEAPGLSEQPDFLKYELAAEVNYRQPQGNPRKGGRYAVAFQQFDDRGMDRYGFQRVEADLQQYISLYKERRVLALHAHASMSDADDNQQVPFYLQRTLGGPDDLRGFRRFRFRDENLLLLQAEYRWEIFTALDGAIFYDAGKVASRHEDLNLRDLESDYGIGFRFGTSNGVFLRIEGAFGSEGGKHFVFRYGHVF
jgi:outer membrane protein assembly factor BamA